MRGLRRGFTMVEVLVAGALMLVVLGGVYRMWSMIARGGTTEAWASTATARLTAADARLRELIARAGFPSMMTSQGLKTPSPGRMDAYRIQVAGTGAADAGGEESAVLGFLAVTPGAAGIEGKAASPPAGARVRILLTGGRRAVKTRAPLADLTLEEQPLAYPSSPRVSALPDMDAPPLGAASRRVLVPDVTRVRISATALADGMPVDVASAVPVGRPCTVRLEVECLEPYHGARRVMRTILAETHAGFVLGGAP